MGSYQSRQIADLMLLLSRFSFFNKTNCLANIIIFCRYIDDGLLIELTYMYLTSLLTFKARTLHKYLSLSHPITTQPIT